MASPNHKLLSSSETEELIQTLATRFNANMHRHEGLEWLKILTKLEGNTEKIWSLSEMEKTGGEPDVINFGADNDVYTFCDCAAESPKGRRSICYDHEALNARKEHKPKDSAVNMAKEMGIEMLTEVQYAQLQKFGNFDTKTSSWIVTPPEIRELGGAIFADRRYNHVFVYHNGAESYYGARAFRGSLKI